MRVTAIGDCGIDRYVDVRADRPGGISLNFAANAILAFERDDRIGVVTALGDDREGDIVAGAIGRFGVAGSVTRRPGATPVQYIDRDASGERHFVRYEAGVLAEHRMTAADRALVAESEVVITTVFNGVVDFFESVLAAPSPGVRAVDFCNLGTAAEPLAFAHRYLGRFDVGFAGIAPDGALVDALEAIARASGRLLVATFGAGGSVALGGRGRITREAVRVSSVVDTTGAGDSFAAGFLSRFVRDRDVGEALRRGAETAARTLGYMGAFPDVLTPWPADAPVAWGRRAVAVTPAAGP